MKIKSASLIETRRAVRAALQRGVGNKKGNGAVVFALSGPLGAGKTAFVKIAARELKARGKVKSPTFVLIRKHIIPRSGRVVIHIDAYRIEKESEFVKIGFRDIVKDDRNIVFVEWPEKIKKLIPKNAVKITFAYGPAKNERIINIK